MWTTRQRAEVVLSPSSEMMECATTAPHLSQIAPGLAPGVRVEAGEVLGLTGDSGNARGLTPHVHFGVSRQTFATDWEVRRGEVDTYPLLRAWEDHRNITPDLP